MKRSGPDEGCRAIEEDEEGTEVYGVKFSLYSVFKLRVILIRVTPSKNAMFLNCEPSLCYFIYKSKYCAPTITLEAFLRTAFFVFCVCTFN